MPDIDLSSSFSLAVLLFSVLFAASITYVVYRRTLPPVSVRWRVVLGILRFLTLLLLFYLLGEPLLSLLRTESIRPSVAVLLDNSRSMTISSKEDPSVLFASVATSPEFSRLDERADLHWFTFDNGMHPLDGWRPDSLRFEGDRTNISGLFEELRLDRKPGNLQAVVLLTDGNSTSPSNPSYAAEALGVATFTIGIGDTMVRKDVRVSGIQHNSIAYAGTRVPVQVTIRSAGFDGEPLQVRLRVQDTDADRATVTLGTGTAEYRTTLFMTPSSAGTVRAEVILSRMDGETTYENNRSIFFTKVLSGKRSVLLLAGAPDPDVSFVRRSLEADSNMTVVTRIERSDGGFLEGDLTADLIRQSDALFLVGYPGPFTTDRSLRTVSTQEAPSKPVFFMLGRRTDTRKLGTIAPLLPMTIDGLLPTEIQVLMDVPKDLRQHPILRLDQGTAWSSLPPLFRPQGRYVLRPESQAIATVRLQSRTLTDPLLVVRSVAGSRSIALLGYGLWRWKMLSPLGGLSDGPFDGFLQNAVQWLTAIEDQRTFRVTPAKESFSALEPTVFQAEVYDESMHPVSDAILEMSVSGEGRTYAVPFSSIDNGQYEGFADVLPPGEYTYSGLARTGGIDIGTDRGSFTVGGLQAEFLETRLNKDLLESIAYRTGGLYYDADNIDGLSERIASLPGFRTREVRSGIQIELAHSAWMLGLLILLLTLEWFFRKRLGLL